MRRSTPVQRDGHFSTVENQMKKPLAIAVAVLMSAVFSTAFAQGGGGDASSKPEPVVVKKKSAAKPADAPAAADTRTSAEKKAARKAANKAHREKTATKEKVTQ
jgi:hypothetical protein